jgi:hypothetical protein
LVLIAACTYTTPRKPSSCLDLKNQGKKSAKTRKLGFLKNDCAWGGGDSRIPTKNQGENQGGRKPSVLVGFLRQNKRTVHTLSGVYPGYTPGIPGVNGHKIIKKYGLWIRDGKKSIYMIHAEFGMNIMNLIFEYQFFG